MSDDELELLVSGVLERAAGYLGVAPPAPPPGAPERAVLGRFLELVRAAPGWTGGAPNPIFARFFGR
jgi:hypothetical protein